MPVNLRDNVHKHKTEKEIDIPYEKRSEKGN